MKSVITYKLQGNGQDSWIERFYNDDETEFIVKNEVQPGVIHYENPEAKKGAAIQALMNATPEEIAQIKQLLNL